MEDTAPTHKDTQTHEGNWCTVQMHPNVLMHMHKSIFRNESLVVSGAALFPLEEALGLKSRDPLRPGFKLHRLHMHAPACTQEDPIKLKGNACV